MVRFEKKTNRDSESDRFDFKRFQKENITFNENEWRVLSDNYFNCKKWFTSSSQRFERSNALIQEYSNIIKEQLKLNVVEKVSPSATNNSDQIGNIQYLPYRPVIKDNRVASEVRIVFDASSNIKGPSLNDCLHPVPLYYICRVLFGVTSSPFLLMSTISTHIKSYNNGDPKFVEQFLRSLYVDKLNSGSENIHDCYNFYNKAKARLDQASFNLRKFQTNSSGLEYLIKGAP